MDLLHCSLVYSIALVVVVEMFEETVFVESVEMGSVESVFGRAPVRKDVVVG